MENLKNIILSKKIKKNHFHIKIHYSFYLLLLLFLYLGKFNELIIIIISLFFHESAHAITSLAFKKKPKKITLTIFGLYCDLDMFGLSKTKKTIILLSGVMMNILLLLLGIFINNEILVHYNFLMIIFSLIPIYPLDGYGLLMINNKNKKTICLLSFIFLLLLSLLLKSIAIFILFIFLLTKQKDLKDYYNLEKIRNTIYFFNNQNNECII